MQYQGVEIQNVAPVESCGGEKRRIVVADLYAAYERKLILGFGSYGLLTECLCTTERQKRVLTPECVDPFSFSTQMPVFSVFYSCVRKLNSSVSTP
jgi:hypothetical protein